ncbi:MAG: electron transport complex subunit RsxC [Candidatus Ruminococcus intestinipullorum]|nr:electron transport complex subunit RsxC [Candidatus Ruminococcus intestinipullorum]
MGVLTFKGGIHPQDGKSLSKDQPIMELLPKGELVYPISQHIGAPANPLVKKGDYVLKGQKIAEAGGYVSSPIYASVSGTVKAVEMRFNPTGTQVNSIVIENDGEYQEVEAQPVTSLEQLSREEIIEKISEAGVVGMGGAGFPTKVKISPKNPESIEYIIANGAECEPYITADYRRMLEYTDDIVSGMRVLLTLFPNAKGIFAVEDNKKDCANKIREAISGEARMEVKVLETKYPQGAERQLIYATTKRAIHAAKLPADAGCIVDNVETLIAIHNAVILGKPLVERVITVSGDNIKNPANYKVPLGISHSELVEASGGFLESPKKLISGGPMMGFAMVTLDAPVTKTSSALLAFKNDDVAAAKETACINCGRCVEVCPSRIIPSRLADLAQRHAEEGFVKMNGLECVECGSCSYVCPAKRNLKQAIGSMRKIALANRRK